MLFLGASTLCIQRLHLGVELVVPGSQHITPLLQAMLPRKQRFVVFLQILQPRSTPLVDALGCET